MFIFDKTNNVSGTQVLVERTGPRTFEVTVLRSGDEETSEFPLDTTFSFEEFALEYAHVVLAYS